MALMNWAFKRQIFYLSAIFLFVAVFGFLIILPSFKKAPTCTDNKQNGDETGIDCGGPSCQNFCFEQADPVSILWSRAFKVVPGRYNAIAYLVNHNKNAAVEKINYRFTFRDANRVYIGKHEGTTFIPPSGNFAIFDPGIDVGNSIPVHVDFEFTDKMPQWQQVPQNKIDQLKILVSNIQLIDENTAPRLSATVKNSSLFTIPNVDVIVILYDKLGNAISTSRTYLNQFMPLQNVDVNFTWPEPLPGEVVSKEIIPMYDIFSVKLQ